MFHLLPKVAVLVTNINGHGDASNPIHMTDHETLAIDMDF